MAHQSDWQKQEWQRERIRGELARGAYKSTPKIEAFLRGEPLTKPKAKQYGPASFDDLLKPLNREMKKTLVDKIAENMTESEGKSGKKKGPTKGAIKKALANGQTIEASTPSDCFVSLTAEASDEGMVLVTATFRNRTRGDWFYEMPLDDFLDWANDDLGVAFNEWVRGNYEV